jgi:serine/threonine-protein kinase RsbW
MQGQREPASQRTQGADALGLRWWRVFPGEPEQLRVLRQWLKDLLPECEALHDLLLVAHELGANAVYHTASGQGGQFSVEVMRAGELVRVTVGDGGGPSEPGIVDDPAGEHGRGLRLVQSLSAGMGVSGDERGRFVHADLPWAANGGPAPHPAEWSRARAAQLRALQGRFPEVPVWFGLATQRWWALVVADGGDRLVSTGSPGELAVVLTALYPGVVAHGHAATDHQPAAAPCRSLADLAEATP